MRTLSTALENHIQQDVTSLVTCWKVTRKDGVELFFTDASEDIVVGGQTFKAKSGYMPTMVPTSSDLNVDTLGVNGIIDDEGVTEDDIIAGRYEHATVEIFQVNSAAPDDGTIMLRVGTIGEVKLRRNVFEAELRGLAQKAQQKVGQVYTKSCRADLGDARCGVTLATYTVSGAVTQVSSGKQFTDSTTADITNKDNQWFRFGLLTWTSGNNNGLQMEVKSSTAAGVFTLYEDMPYEIQVGDTFSVYAGCDKLHTTCRDKFNNIVNFRGEPFIAGTDKLIRYP